MAASGVSGNRLPIIAALDALEAGDQDLAVSILLDALDGAATPSGARTHTCPDCQVDYEFPGLLDQHRILFHALEDAA